MKIAIHNTLVDGSFTERWVRYCQNNKIDFELVDAYSSDIVQQLEGFTGFMWHHSQVNYKDALFAKQLLYSLELKGIKVFPNFYTTWHFDDKVGQKYLLEAIDAPFVPTHVFFSKESASNWIETVGFPKVFKLRGGAGSINVKLVDSRQEARKLIIKAFGRGFPQYDKIGSLRERLRKWKQGNGSIINVCKGLGRFFIPNEFSKFRSNEIGYVYFQDYIPNNKDDTRIVVIGDKAFGVKRLVRKNDFRASGSGLLVYDRRQIDERCVEIAFKICRKMKSQSIAVDFVFDDIGNPLILEVSYGFYSSSYDPCEGYWDEKMNWYSGKNFDFCGWMVEDIL